MSDNTERNEWTPSTEQVRSHYVFNQQNQWDAERGAAFDRWLVEVRTVDAEEIAAANKAMDWGQAEPAAAHPERHDPRCISLTDSEFNDVCDCRTLRTIDHFDCQETEVVPPYQGCEVPPAGWWCSREKGHDGPCAARPVTPESETN